MLVHAVLGESIQAVSYTVTWLTTISSPVLLLLQRLLLIILVTAATAIIAPLAALLWPVVGFKFLLLAMLRRLASVLTPRACRPRRDGQRGHFGRPTHRGSHLHGRQAAAD